MNKMMDDLVKSFPWDEMLDAMIPVYQKHLTKGDATAMVAFYSAPTGQKLLKEMPVITGEAMQLMMPMMRKQIDSTTEQVQMEVASMIKESGQRPGEAPQSSPN